MQRNTYLNLVPVDEARNIWFEALKDFTLPEETVPLDQALGRYTACAIAAKRSSPAFHAAAMDGVAVRAEDTFAASPKNPLTLAIGSEAIWINTGQALPAGCNAVIMIEHLVPGDNTVTIEQAAFPWQHVRKLGEDLVQTEIILAPGTRIGPYEIGALAAGGVLEVAVVARPKVAIIPSGSELVPLKDAREEDLLKGRVWPEFNSLIFRAQLAEACADIRVQDIVPDDPEKLSQALDKALADGADIVLINAGSSAGSKDFTAHVVRSKGQLLVHGISVMPGKPTVLGVIDNHPVIGAPGYPVSATVAIEEFLLPLLARLQHSRVRARESVQATLCNPIPSRPGMEERIRVQLGQVGDNVVAVPLTRGAGTVTSLSRADGILTIPAACEGLDREQSVEVALLTPRERIRDGLLAIGSHDNTLGLIDSLLRRLHPRFRLTSAHVGSLGGLQALARGKCHLAGSHLLNPADGVYNRQAIRDNLPDMPCSLIRLVDRVQGFMVKPGNPLNVTSVQDLIREDVTFINRQRGSGTRVLLDHMLHEANISPRGIRGYTAEEYTHMGVAVAVVSGRADAGLGVLSSARALGLDFVPVGVEEYDLVIPQHFMDDERILALLDLVRSAAFKEQVEALGGYGLEHTGEVIWTWSGSANSQACPDQ